MSDANQSYGSFHQRTVLCPFGNLVALHVRWKGNQIDGKFPLNLQLEVEEHQFEIPGKPGLLRRIGRGLSKQVAMRGQSLRLSIRLKFCYVRYREKGLRVVGESKYKSSIAIGKYEMHQSEKSQASKKSGLRLGLAGKSDIKLKSIDASVGSHLDANHEVNKDRSVEMTILASPDIYEVQVVPNGWRVGDQKHGDFLKSSGCLDGRYFDRLNPDFTQTCEVEFLDGEERGRLTFTVSVRDGLHVERLGGGRVDDDTRAAVEEAMRDRIAAIRVERDLLPASDKRGHAAREITLLKTICDVVRATDRESKNQPRIGRDGQHDGQT